MEKLQIDIHSFFTLLSGKITEVALKIKGNDRTALSKECCLCFFQLHFLQKCGEFVLFPSFSAWAIMMSQA